MTPEETLSLLLERWPAVELVVSQYGGNPETDLSRDGLVMLVRILAQERVDAEGRAVRDHYVFKLDFADYDDHAPRVWACNPADPKAVGQGRQFYPKIAGNNVFSHETFLCMPGDRRCYEQGHHPEWKKREHFHPEIVIGSLFELLRSPGYEGRA